VLTLTGIDLIALDQVALGHRPDGRLFGVFTHDQATLFLFG
jgi:hypothetical protein